ncbi:MAG TPA: hypothetical protein VGF88_10150 [Acidobacteriaceae bacterium]|jgi:hypothetical protein
MLAVGEGFELASTRVEVDVQAEEYVRLLGYPRGWALEGRAEELAERARDWYAENGRPWVYARQAETFATDSQSVCIDGMRFASKGLENTLGQAGAHSVILVAVGAGPEAEEEAQRRWTDDKPDEYFFLEMYAAAVVEHLTTTTGARLCDWAEQHGMAVLPHYSPGYPEWDVAEQPRLLELMLRTRKEAFPTRLEVLESGMLRPRKSQLAVFGVTRHAERLRSVRELIPCENCSFGPCQYRRAPYRKPPRGLGELVAVRPPVLDVNAVYSVNSKALARWARERLLIDEQKDGSLDVVFRYDGTTCTNMGRPMTFHYRVKLGSREEGYPICEQQCAPVKGDTGHTFMCQYIENPERLMGAVDREKPLSGQKLNAVLSWRREANGAGCFCEAASRNHKWGLVLETIHYALAQKERERATES